MCIEKYLGILTIFLRSGLSIFSSPALRLFPPVFICIASGGSGRGSSCCTGLGNNGGGVGLGSFEK